MNKKTPQDKRLSGFLLDRIALKSAKIEGNAIHVEWDADGCRVKNSYIFPFVFAETPAFAAEATREVFAVIVGVINCLRFGAMLPKHVDLSLVEDQIPQPLMEFIAYSALADGSEYSWQLGFRQWDPEWVVTTSRKAVRLPVLSLAERNPEVLVAFGGGKDGLLCAKLLEKAGLTFHLWQYLDPYYQNGEEEMGPGLPWDQIPAKEKHIVQFREDVYTFETTRRNESGIESYCKELHPENVTAFTISAGEPTMGMILGVALQAAYGIRLAVFGDERSAKFPNFFDPDTEVDVYHSGTKTPTYEVQVQRCWGMLFGNIQWSSLLRPFYDSAIFKLLGPVTDGLVYGTHSCNRQTPWCFKCPKCLYVCSGLTAHLDRSKVLEQFKGTDVFQTGDDSKIAIWKGLLGLVPQRPLECVGQQKEVQLYFWYMKGRCPELLDSPAFKLFQREILEPLGGQQQQKEYFEKLQAEYETIDRDDHFLPDWVSEPVFRYVDQLNILR